MPRVESAGIHQAGRAPRGTARSAVVGANIESEATWSSQTLTYITSLTTMASSPIDEKDMDLRDIEKGSIHDPDLSKELDERFGGGTGGGVRRSVLPPLPGDVETDDESLAPPRPPFATESHYIQSPLEMHPAANPHLTAFQELKILQAELSDFLVQHVAKTTSLQASLQPGDPLKLLRKRGSAFERENGGYSRISSSWRTY